MELRVIAIWTLRVIPVWVISAFPEAADDIVITLLALAPQTE
jgi:hypothetical protein